jgi:Domain of unknown function (DUF4384)
MSFTMPPFLRRPASLLAVAAVLAGCGTMDVHDKTVRLTNEAVKGPEQQPFRSITGFSQSLRCMDNLMIDYGVRDVSMLVEEILDSTKKINAGTRDMLMTAVSDMTRRSRAVRLVAFGRDATNAVSFLAYAQRQSAYEVIPQYDIKGSVSQFDENVIRNQKDFGVGYKPFLNLGISRDAASSVLGLDLSVLVTEDMSMLSGVTSRNSVVILKQGKGADGDAAYHKFGISYSMNLNKSEGQTQALRGLVELAVIELMGKLTKTPYWTCLNGDPKANEEIRLEMTDWYYAMAASQVEIIAYFQNQMRRRGFYDGPIDGRFNPAIDEAIGNYRAALGMSKEAVIDEKFFTAFLGADHSKVARPAEPARFVAVAPPQSTDGAPPPAEAAGPLKLQLTTANDQKAFARGEQINLLLRPTRDAHVYCYLQDEDAKVRRFYPNRFNKDTLVSAAKPLAVPGQMRFRLVMNGKGVKETVACFATPRDVTAQLPNAVVGTDFEPLAVSSLDQVRGAFVNATGGALAQETFNVQVK